MYDLPLSYYELRVGAEQLTQWLPYLIAIVIGLIVGIEREKSNPHQKTMGVRTFLLISLLGAVAGGIENSWLTLMVAAFALALIVISYFNQTHSSDSEVDRGLTTEFAAGLIFCLGYLAHQSPALAAAIGPVVAMILFSKRKLHKFTQYIEPAELEAALLILLAAVVVLDFTPNQTIDPWEVFNPRQFGYLVVTLAVLEFLSYILSRAFGEKKGALVSGFLGGFVSSTAVLLSASHDLKNAPDKWKNSLCSVLAAKLAAIVELFLIVGLVSPPLLLGLLIPIGPGFLLGAIALFFVARKAEQSDSRVKLKSPLDWWGVFRLAILLAVILAAVVFCERWLGDQATYVLAFVTGLFELHGTSLASATMHSHGQLTVTSASMLIMIATAASLVAKVVMSWFLCPKNFSRLLTVVFGLMILAIGITGWLVQSGWTVEN